MVYVLPLPVCPYAMTVALKPSMVCCTIGTPMTVGKKRSQDRYGRDEPDKHNILCHL